MAPTTRRAMEPRDITRIRWVSDAQAAPDGRRVAFVVTVLSEEKDEYQSSIWLVDRDGGEPRRFTQGPKRDTAPRWSPDGRQLAFLSERPGDKKAQVYVIAVEGGEARRLTETKQGAANPVWSPDGTRIAFTARTGGWEEPEQEEEKAKSKPARVITTLKYRLNGEGFTYDRRSHILVVPAAGGAAQQVTDGDWNDGEPSWSPDGRQLAFASARHDERDEDNAADVWVVPAEGGEARRLTDTAGPVGVPVFSPDGRTIAYTGNRFRNEAGRNTLVFTIAVEGGEARTLSAALDRSVPTGGRVCWSPDGAWLTFGVEDQGDLPLYRVRADGAAAPVRVVDGARQVVSFSLAGDALAFTAAAPTAPAEVFLCRADGAAERPLTHLNGDWQAELALSTPQRYRYERAGRLLDCWVMRPYAWEPGKRYPALLNIHGGPMTQYGHTFFDEFQVYAGAGFGVIFTNPRGSQGYGEEFTRAIVRNWGDVDFADLMAGLDEALRRCDWIDPNRLGVMGGSYGGYLTSWTVGHTDRFQAACSERALNSFVSMFGTSDIGSSFPEQHSGALPWEDPAWYVERSPLTYAPRITTPLLILHAENDLRCPIEQGEQLYVALKKLHQEVVLVRFPDENHEMSRSGKPRHRLERFRLILDWFAKHLQGDPA